MNNIHYSSKSNEWETPKKFYEELDAEFNFTLDPCATDDNHKCAKYYTAQQDGLAQSWDNDRVFCNPPYGRVIGHWVKKASESKGLVVMLLPARTDTRYFHEYIYHRAEIRFLKGRLHFNDAPAGAPFPLMVVVFRPTKGVESV